MVNNFIYVDFQIQVPYMIIRLINWHEILHQDQ